MKNTLSEKRKFLPVDRCLQRQLADIRSRYKCFFSRAREDQNTHGLVIARIEQCTLQLLDCFAIQRIQHLWPIKGDVCNPILLLVQNVFVTHLFSFLLHSAFLCVLCVFAFYFLSIFFSPLKLLRFWILRIRIIIEPASGFPPVPPRQHHASQQRRRGKSPLLELF